MSYAECRMCAGCSMLARSEGAQHQNGTWRLAPELHDGRRTQRKDADAGKVCRPVLVTLSRTPDEKVCGAGRRNRACRLF